MRWNGDPAAGALTVAEQALADASVVWVAISIDAPNTLGRRFTIACPVSGRLTAIRVSSGFAPDVAMVFNVYIGGILVSDGQFTLPIDHWWDNVIAVNPVVDNTANVLSALAVEHSSGLNTLAGQVTVLLGFTRAP